MDISADILTEFLTQAQGDKKWQKTDLGVDITPDGLFASATNDIHQVTIRYKFAEPVGTETLTLNLSKLNVVIASLERFAKETVSITLDDNYIVFKSGRKSFKIPQIGSDFIKRGKVFTEPIAFSFPLLKKDARELLEEAKNVGDSPLVIFSHKQGEPTLNVRIEGGSPVKFDNGFDIPQELPDFTINLRVFGAMGLCSGDVVFDIRTNGRGECLMFARYSTAQGIEVEHVLAPIMI